MTELNTRIELIVSEIIGTARKAKTLEDLGQANTNGINEITKLVKNLSLPAVVGRSEQLICDTCKSGLIDYPEINRRTCRCGGLGYNVTD